MKTPRYEVFESKTLSMPVFSANWQFLAQYYARYFCKNYGRVEKLVGARYKTVLEWGYGVLSGFVGTGRRIAFVGSGSPTPQRRESPVHRIAHDFVDFLFGHLLRSNVLSFEHRPVTLPPYTKGLQPAFSLHQDFAGSGLRIANTVFAGCADEYAIFNLRIRRLFRNSL